MAGNAKQRRIIIGRLSRIAAPEPDRIVDLGNGRGMIKLTYDLMPPHGDYGKMVRISAYLMLDGEFLGYAQRITIDEHDPDAVSVGGVRVKEAYRRQGIATALYDAAEDLAAKIGARLIPSDLLSEDARLFWADRQNKKDIAVMEGVS